MPSTKSLPTHPPTTIEVGNGATTDASHHRSRSSNNIPSQVQTNLGDNAVFLHRQDNRNNNIANDPTTTSLASHDIDQVIRGFQHELDTLSKSFDILSQSQAKRTTQMAAAAAAASTTERSRSTYATPHQRSSYESYTGTDSQARSITEPRRSVMDPIGKTSKSENCSQSHIKPRDFLGNNDNSLAADSTFTTHHTAATATTTGFQEPRPVDTPIVSAANTATTSGRYDLETSSSRYLHKGERPQDTIRRLEEAVEERDHTISRLQRETSELRKQLLFAQGANTPHDAKYHSKQRNYYQPSRREPMLDGSNRPRYHEHYPEQYRTTTNRPQPDRYYDEMRHMNSSLSTHRSTQLSTPPRDEDENTLGTATATRVGVQTGFTPGTKFVAVSSVKKNQH